MLTAKSEEIDKVLGLELGADDYITKPFSMREFRSRVKAALRRSGMARSDTDDERPIEVRGLKIDPGKRTVARHGETSRPPTSSSRSSPRWPARPGRVFTRDMLLARVWGDSAYRDPRTIDVHIRHLREKIEVRSEGARVPVHGARRRIPLPRRRGADARAAVAAQPAGPVFALIIVGAIGTIYLSVTPRLEASLTSQRLDDVVTASRQYTPDVGVPCAADGRRRGRRQTRATAADGSSAPRTRSAPSPSASARRSSSCRRPRRHVPFTDSTPRRRRRPDPTSQASAREALGRAPAGGDHHDANGQQAVAASRSATSERRRRRRRRLRRLARRRRGQRLPDPPPGPALGRDRARDRHLGRLSRRAGAGGAREAARARGAQGRGGRLLQPIKADSDDELGQLAARSTTCRTSSPGWTARASSSSRPRRTSCARRSSPWAGSWSCWPTRTSTRRRGARSWSRSAARSTACATSRPSCSISRGWRRARWSCGPSRPTSAARARSRGGVHARRRTAPSDVELDLRREPIELDCDPERVAQVLRILLDNALRHTPPGTDVRVSAARANGHVRLEVADGGPGINRQNMPHIFEPFFTSDEQAQGAGLGLAIARSWRSACRGDSPSGPAPARRRSRWSCRHEARCSRRRGRRRRLSPRAAARAPTPTPPAARPRPRGPRSSRARPRAASTPPDLRAGGAGCRHDRRVSFGVARAARARSLRGQRRGRDRHQRARRHHGRGGRALRGERGLRRVRGRQPRRGAGRRTRPERGHRAAEGRPEGPEARPLPLGQRKRCASASRWRRSARRSGRRSRSRWAIVSAVDRAVASLTDFAIAGAIQTDAAINPGNSGGPLVGADGRVIGVNQQIQSRSGGGEGVGFAVPIDTVKRSIDQLREDGTAAYAYLGVSSVPLYPQLVDDFGLKVEKGAWVQELNPGSPAAGAGVRGGSGREALPGRGVRARRRRHHQGRGHADRVRRRPVGVVWRATSRARRSRSRSIAAARRQSVDVKLGERPARGCHGRAARRPRRISSRHDEPSSRR